MAANGIWCLVCDLWTQILLYGVGEQGFWLNILDMTSVRFNANDRILGPTLRSISFPWASLHAPYCFPRRALASKLSPAKLIKGRPRSYGMLSEH